MFFLFFIVYVCFFFFFFFQAEDGIRDLTVTGVQTCALPIYRHGLRRERRRAPLRDRVGSGAVTVHDEDRVDAAQRSAVRDLRAIGRPGRIVRSEERRVGKECRARWWRKSERKSGSRT